jgi:hypothetical protein
MGNLCCDRERALQFSCSFFDTVKLHSLTEILWGPLTSYCALRHEDKAPWCNIHCIRLKYGQPHAMASLYI